jgi:hypothetical protein
MHLRLFIAMAGAVIATAAAPAPLAQSQSFDGAYKGSVECEQIFARRGTSSHAAGNERPEWPGRGVDAAFRS